MNNKAIVNNLVSQEISSVLLVHRQKRIDGDIVHDNAEKELIKEIETIEGVLSLLIRTREQVTEQIRLDIMDC